MTEFRHANMTSKTFFWVGVSFGVLSLASIVFPIIASMVFGNIEGEGLFIFFMFGFLFGAPALLFFIVAAIAGGLNAITGKKQQGMVQEPERVPKAWTKDVY